MDTASLKITHSMLKLVAEIDEFKGRWSAVRTLSLATLEQLHEASRIQSVGSSTRIDGTLLSNEEVAAFLAEPAKDTIDHQDEAVPAGFATALGWLRAQPVDSPLTEAVILQLHRMLFQFSARDKSFLGEYKKNPNFAAAYDQAGKQIGILFETSDPSQTSAEMKRLLEEVTGMEKDGLHPLLITALFVFRFLAIHPFREGNGKLSGLLATALLLRFGYSYVPYASLERMIEEDRTSYYASLRKTHQSLKWATPEWEAWIEFFLHCLVRQKRKLEIKMEMEKAVPLELSGLALAIAGLMEEQPRISVASIVQATGASRNTVRSALRYLIQNSLLAPGAKEEPPTTLFPSGTFPQRINPSPEFNRLSRLSIFPKASPPPPVKEKIPQPGERAIPSSSARPDPHPSSQSERV